MIDLQNYATIDMTLQFDLDESKTGNSYIVKKGNSLVGRFPVSRTMVLVEDVAERSAN